jgi:alpha-beta hydrolase superfamily lysophospholipase
MTIDSTLSSFIAIDGRHLAIQDWPLGPGQPERGSVLLVHGLGEHVGRYDHVARQLNNWGFAVRGYDQFGHGESEGPRGGLPTPTRLLADLAEMVDSTRARQAPGTPLILLGHSMGGLVAARFVSLGLRPVQALVLSSPALDLGLSTFQKLLLAVLPGLAPNLSLGNGLDAELLSHDPKAVADYRADPLVHDRICPRLAQFMADAGAATVASAAQWQVPTLLMYAGADRLVNPAGSRTFAAAASGSVVSAHCFEGLFHELFNELDREAVFTQLKRWLEQRF